LAENYRCINIQANDVTLDCQGHTIQGDDVADYGIYIHRDSVQTTNITIKNCIVTDWDSANIYLYRANGNNITNVTSNSSPDYGFYLYYSDSNTILNSITNSENYGFHLDFSDSNTIKNSTANSNNYGGIHLYFSGSNIISNCTINSNSNGVIIRYNSDNNIIANSTISNNTDAGLYLDESGTEDPEYNKIYNCLFNNSGTYGNVRIDDGIPNPNYFNTTKQSGTRIYSDGDKIGGNYYTNPSGTGYSDTCTDSDSDGFCDSPYTLATNNVDYLPLSDEYGLVSSITLNSPVDNYNTSDSTPDFNFTVSGSANSYHCELFLNDTGYGVPNLEDDTEDSYSCEGTFEGDFPCSNAVDENWSSYAKCLISKDILECHIYENYSTLSDSANWTAKLGGTYGNLAWEVYYWNGGG